MADNNCSFLADTQADISIIKISALSHNFNYNASEIIRIKGITSSSIKSLGTVLMNLIIDNIAIEHKFHLVTDEMAIPTDGIIGKDFIKMHKCKLDYETMLFKIHLPFAELEIPMTYGITNDSTIIPARSEVYRMFKVKSSEFPCIIESRVQILNKHMPKDAPKELMDLCLQFSQIFAMPDDEGSVNNFYKQTLTLKDEIPVYVKNYRLPQTQKSEINSQVKALLSKDLIELSTSSYNSPLLLVPKKSTDGTRKWRLCVDYRLLNKKLIPDKFPLPRIEEIIDSLGNAKHFSVMDLQSGFHQIPLDKKSRPTTAFSTENGFYQWKVLPFGLSVAPSSFSRMMALTFSGLGPNRAFIYMDDIIVVGFSEKTHLDNLKAVFETCDKFNLKLNPEKCDFFKTEVNFLGLTCSAQGILPNKEKSYAIENYPTPLDKEATKRFVAFANYYNRFIPNFAKLSQPLNQITRKRAIFEWSKECDKSFQEIKKLLLSPQILKYPDFSKNFILTVDASNFACGAVLSQMSNNSDHPICYISKTFKKGEINKPIIEKELLAIHFAIKKLRPYLYGRSFTVRSDHKPLIYLYNLKNPSSKLTNLRLDLEEYDFIVEYIKGRDNVAADALSRIFIQDFKDLNGLERSEIFAVTRSTTRKMNEKKLKIQVILTRY